MFQDSAKYEEFKLLTLLSEGSEYAFQVIYDRYRNRIFHVAIQYLKSPTLGQEVVQDVFLKLWFERGHIRTDLPVEGWLYTVARNNILNRLKKISNEWKALHLLSYKPFQSSPAWEKAETAEYAEMLQQAIEGLPDQQKRIFHLSRHENLTYGQIAEKLGISTETVKTHLRRALRHIRDHFSDKGVQLPLLLLFSSFF
ncbi:MAG: RNA polymerase sigma-70 factor [Chitinophagaceae bacterium]|nr:RNA polymerase sigma-70 factor [Chitinophagaceae bacterium]